MKYSGVNSPLNQKIYQLGIIKQENHGSLNGQDVIEEEQKRYTDSTPDDNAYMPVNKTLELDFPQNNPSMISNI